MGANAYAATISATFSMIGVAAGIAKLPQVLSTPEVSATSDMNPM